MTPSAAVPAPGILVLRALGIGDLATAVPALRGLRAAAPDRELVLAAPAWLAPLVALTGAVDALLPTSGLAPRRWPGPPPDRAVNLHGRGPRSHHLLRAARPRALYAFACAAADHHDGPRWREDEHEVHRWCRLLRWYGIGSDPGDLALHRPGPDLLPAGAPVGATLVHPGGKAAVRRWPVTRFAAVAQTLAADGHPVVVTGSAREWPRAAAVARLAGLPPGAVLAGTTGVDGLAALVAHARLVVSGDTGAAHLATAYRTPSVVLFGPVSPARWGPPPDRPEHRALWHPEAPAAPVPDQPHPALRAVTVAEVLRAAGDVLGQAAIT